MKKTPFIANFSLPLAITLLNADESINQNRAAAMKDQPRG